MAEEQKQPKVLEKLRHIYVVSLLPPTTASGFAGHPVALHDIDIRHPNGPSLVVAGPEPIKVAVTPAVAAAIKNSQIKEVSEDEALDILHEHASRKREARRQALAERENTFDDPLYGGDRPRFTDLSEDSGQSALKAGRLSARQELAQELPNDDPGGSKAGVGTVKQYNRVNPNRMSVSDLQAEAAKLGIEVPEKATKETMADLINTRYDDLEEDAEGGDDGNDELEGVE